MAEREQDRRPETEGTGKPVLENLQIPPARAFQRLRDTLAQVPEGELRDRLVQSFADIIDRFNSKSRLNERAGLALGDLSLELKATRFDRDALRRELEEQKDQDSQD